MNSPSPETESLRDIDLPPTDVLLQEPPKDGNPLLAADIPRLIVTPHSAWGSQEARQRIVGQVVENAAGFFAGAPLRVVG